MQSYDFPADFSKSTLPRLQSYVLFNTCRASQSEPLASFGFLPSAVRVAQALKIHIEGNSTTAVDNDLRRRLWWHLIYLDAEASLLSGLPNLIHEDDYTTEMPFELHDESIGTQQGSTSEHSASPMMLTMKSRWQWALQMRRWRKRPPKVDELNKFEDIITDLMSNIPDDEENRGSRTYIHLQIDRAICCKPQHFVREGGIRSVKCDHYILR